MKKSNLLVVIGFLISVILIVCFFVLNNKIEKEYDYYTYRLPYLKIYSNFDLQNYEGKTIKISSTSIKNTSTFKNTVEFPNGSYYSFFICNPNLNRVYTSNITINNHLIIHSFENIIANMSNSYYANDYIGIVKKIDDHTQNEIIRYNKSNFDLSSFFKENSYYIEIKENIYDKIEKKQMWNSLLLVIGVAGVLISILFVLITNSVKIKKFFANKKIAKVLFILSSLPFIIILIISIYNAIFGFTFLFSTSYGFDAFISCLMIYGAIFSTVIPVIPICIIYDIIYLIASRKKKATNV